MGNNEVLAREGIDTQCRPRYYLEFRCCNNEVLARDGIMLQWRLLKLCL